MHSGSKLIQRQSAVLKPSASWQNCLLSKARARWGHDRRRKVASHITAYICISVTQQMILLYLNKLHTTTRTHINLVSLAYVLDEFFSEQVIPSLSLINIFANLFNLLLSGFDSLQLSFQSNCHPVLGLLLPCLSQNENLHSSTVHLWFVPQAAEAFLSFSCNPH